MDAHDTLRRRNTSAAGLAGAQIAGGAGSVIATGASVVNTAGAGSVNVTSAGAADRFKVSSGLKFFGEGSVKTTGARVNWVVNTTGTGSVNTSGAGSVITSGGCLIKVAGNFQDYVSDDFCAEAVDRMRAAVSRIDGMRSNSQSPTIYKVSNVSYYDNGSDGIKPVDVRIGLVNWSEEDQSKEKLHDYKWYCVKQLINLNLNSSILEPAASRTPVVLRECLNIMIHVESKIRRIYTNGDILIDSNSLALMMVLDGCFILHRLLKLAHLGEEDEAGNGCHQLCGSDDDRTERLYGSPQKWEYVKRELLLFENQIPFFVLRMLLEKLDIGESEHNLVKGSLRLFRSCCPGMLRSNCSESSDVIIAYDQVDHLLHLLYLSVALPRRPPQAQPSDQGNNVCVSMDPQWICCSKVLAEAGIRFSKREKAESFLDIKFERGVLEIPQLLLDNFSNALFRNLIAFEQSQSQSLCIYNYAIFMGDLIQTADDIQILQQKHILVNLMNKDASSFFNGICTSRTLMPSNNNYLIPLMENLRKYNDCRWHRWGADLVRSYFSSPRAALSTLAATIMLGATLLGLLIAAYAYFKPRK